VSSSVASGSHDDIEEYMFQFDIVSDFKHGNFICEACASKLTGDTFVITTSTSIHGIVGVGEQLTVGSCLNPLDVTGVTCSADSCDIQLAGLNGCIAFDLTSSVQDHFSLSHYVYEPKVVSSEIIYGSAPFVYLLRDLPEVCGTEYYIRVAAHNDVPVQKISPTNDPPDNTNWSSTLTATTANQVPYAPENVEISIRSGTSLIVYITPPTRDGMGGTNENVDNYRITYDTSADFSGSPVQLTVAANSLSELSSTGPLVYWLDGLTTGTTYYVSVEAENAVGFSSSKVASVGLAPEKSPLPPSQVIVTTAEHQSTPITHIDVDWVPTSDNGGNEVTGYKVEWWLDGGVAISDRDEEQIISLSWDTTPDLTADCFNIKYGGQVSPTLHAGINEVNMRDALLNMHVSNTFIFDDVKVTRNPINTNKGFTWTVTFLGSTHFDGTEIKGDMPKLIALPASASVCSALTLDVFDVVHGVQQATATVSGKQETQRLTIEASSSLAGFFRVKYEGSIYSEYLPVNSDDAALKDALESLPTVGSISVSKTVDTSNTETWLVTFLNNVGNLGSIVIDSTLVTGNNVVVTLEDGDNLLLGTSDLSCTECAVGEEPIGYGFVELDADATSYQIQGLITGASYFVSVSTKNMRGYGDRETSSPSSISLPRQIPGPPTGVAAYVRWGHSDQLRVTIAEPLSDGGAGIEKYVVEWDPTPTFDNPGREEFPCPEYPTRSVWIVTTYQSSGAGDLTGGSFNLGLDCGLTACSEMTLPIAWDAPAMAADEVANLNEADSGIHCEGTDGQSAWEPHCSANREASSGSMQSKLETMASVNSVKVTRSDGPDTGSKVWSITFLDDGNDFELSLVPNDGNGNSFNNLVPDSGTWDISVLQRVEGTETPFPDCTGTQIIPSAGGLTQGQYYYVRSFAYNTIGYSVAQEAVSPEKPQVVPGLPTGVTLEVVSSYQLRLVFSPPDDNGGDTITQYLVEWDTVSTFDGADFSSFYVTELSAGAPYFYVMGSLADPLVTGQNYWVRVSACNTGSCPSGVCCGEYQAGSPSFLNPHESPSAPTDVGLHITSSTMLTVTWDEPTNDGGDAITGYRIEHDISSAFNSLALTPDKDSIDVGPDERSYTITDLTAGTSYFVQVYAINDAGAGTPQTSSPEFAVPALQLPGLPHSIIASGGASSGEIDLQWDRPFIPYHNKPCFGTESAPTICPEPAGGGDAQSNGGATIDKYQIQYCDMASDCTSGWGGTVSSYSTAEATATEYTLENLNPGIAYAIRIAAVNSVGPGNFCQYGEQYCPDSGTSVTATATA
jgi:hypothetical protein